MRYLLISAQHAPSHGGIGTYVQRFVAAAARARWRVEIVTRADEGGESVAALGAAAVHEVRTPDMEPSFAARVPGLRRQEVIRPYRYALWSCAVAEKLLQIPGEFDAMEFVDCQAEGFAALGSAEVRRRFAGTPMIVHAHTPMFVEEAITAAHGGAAADLSRFGRCVYHRWERQALRLADGVIATSRLLLDRLPPAGAACVVPYPIEQERESETQQGMDAAGGAAGQGAELIVLIGSVQPRKGVEPWARSLNRVLAHRPRAQALLIGPDTHTAPDGLSMAAHVQRLILERFLPRFRWMGAMRHEEVRALLGQATLVVVPSLFESFSFVAAEALLRGTPVLVSDRVGLAEHVPALPAPPAGDADALADAQIAMLEDIDSARCHAARCRAAMLRACAPATVLQGRSEFIDAIASRCGRRACPSHSDCDPDTWLQMREFIASVESGETSYAAVSSAGS